MRILTEPQNALITQYMALLETEGSRDQPSTIRPWRRSPKSPQTSTNRTENIGARRLHTIMERLLEDFPSTRPRLREKTDGHRRGLRARKTERHQEGRRFEPVHSL